LIEFCQNAAANTTTANPSTTQNTSGLSAQTAAHRSTTENFFNVMISTSAHRVLDVSSTSAVHNMSISVNNALFTGKCFITYSYFPAPSSPTALAQYKVDGQTAISTGGWVNSTSLVLKFNMSSRIADTLYPVVEVKPVSQAFNGSNLSTGTAVNYPGSGVVVGSVTISGLTDGTTYHWRARVSSLNGNSLWVSFGGNLETEADFGCDLSSPVVSLNAPINGAATNYINITFSWSGIDYPTGSNSGIKQYTLQISTDINFGVVHYSSTTKALACGYLLSQGTYYWRVRAEDNAGNIGLWTSPWSILVDTTPPSVPVLTAPLNGYATNQMSLTFSWEASDDSGIRGGSGVRGYEIYI
jgi:hypothetical protein